MRSHYVLAATLSIWFFYPVSSGVAHMGKGFFLVLILQI